MAGHREGPGSAGPHACPFAKCSCLGSAWSRACHGWTSLEPGRTTASPIPQPCVPSLHSPPSHAGPVRKAVGQTHRGAHCRPVQAVRAPGALELQPTPATDGSAHAAPQGKVGDGDGGRPAVQCTRPCSVAECACWARAGQPVGKTDTRSAALGADARPAELTAPTMAHRRPMQAVLMEIAVQNKRGPYKDLWELKKGYRLSGGGEG